MRILYFSSRACWPVNTGARLRDYSLASQLSRHAELTYFGLTYPGETESDGSSPDLPPPDRVFQRLVMLPKARPYTPANLLRGLVGPTPVTVWNCTTPAIAAALDEVGREGDFDSVQIEGSHLARYLPVLRAFRKAPGLLCDWHNIESELMLRYSESHPGLARGLYARRTASLIERTEAGLLSSCDAHTLVSRREREKLLERAPSASLHVIENGVDPQYFSDAGIDNAYARWSGRSSTPARNRLLFVGSMDYHANVDGAVYFSREIWPAIGKRWPGLRCTIVGRSPAPPVEALRSPDVEVTGTVPDIRPYYREALAVVVPLRVGSGTRLKILEAMAAGVPVISTTLGAEGLDARPGCDFLIADHPAAFAAAAAELQTQPDTWRRLAAAGRDLIARSYDWRALGDRLFAIHQAIARA